MGELDDVVKEFLVESYENLDQLDRKLVALEEDPKNRDILSGIFRTVHTIKGTCGFLGFSKLEKVTHVGENLLSKLRDGKLDLNAQITSSLLTLVDAIRQMLGSIEQTSAEGDTDYSALVQTLAKLQEGGAAAAPAVAAAPAPAPAPEAPPVAAPVAAAPVTPTPAPAAPAPANPAAASAVPAKSAEDTSIRVDVTLLDKLMNLVGELVLARNQVIQFTAKNNDSQFLATSQRLNIITTELQESAMKTRMQPIGNVWSKFPRVVRDISVALNKKIRVEMEGKETELDKTIIEAIKDPLTHLVRNSCDHGIEMPEKRQAAGKNPEGRLLLRAYHEGGQVIMEIIDDGGGIDPERIKRKAVEKGLITAEQAARTGDREALNMIFLPGFSTAEKITNVSGRGVGMDVVKTNIEKIGGSVDIQSKAGQGTTIKIKIPLTLAIIPALLITSAGDRYAIPQVSLLELVRLSSDQLKSQIEHIHGAPVYRLRGRLLPLVYLNKELQVDGKTRADGSVNMVVLQADERQFGLVVDEINDTQEIVVKPLSKQLKGLSVFAGATIMGDGKVALILDVMGVAQKASVVGGARERHHGEKSEEDGNRSSTKQSLLLFALGDNRRMALPLSLVARLEEFAPEKIERSGSHEVVQYREQIMPLLHLADFFQVPRGKATGHSQVVVYSFEGRSVGLVVERILDILEETITVQSKAAKPGLTGTAVVQGQVTDFVDAKQIILSMCPEMQMSAAGVGA